MSGEFEPVWQELPLPSEEDRRLFEEWARRQEKENEQDDEKTRVIVIEL